MLRKTVEERPDWQETARANGFVFHHVDGDLYWDERAYWQFTLNEVEKQIEDPSTELYALCLQLVPRPACSGRGPGQLGEDSPPRVLHA